MFQATFWTKKKKKFQIFFTFHDFSRRFLWDFRSQSCMGISWSYFWFRILTFVEKKAIIPLFFLLFIVCIFFVVCIFFLSLKNMQLIQFFLVIGPVITARLFPPGYSHPCIPARLFSPDYSCPIIPAWLFLPDYSCLIILAWLFLPDYSCLIIPAQLFPPNYSYPVIPAQLYLPGYSRLVIPAWLFLPGYSRLVIPAWLFPPGYFVILRFPKWISPLFSLVLSLFPAKFIKSSDGYLQCEWNSDIF